MTRVHLGVLAVCIACSVLLPIPARASGCSPNFYHTDQGWLEKWFTTQPYKSQQDRLVQVYSAIPSITTTVLMAQAQGARDRWESASFNSTPVFTYLFCTSQPTGGTYVIIVSTHQEYENLMFSLTGQTDEAAIAFTVRGFYPFNGNVVNSKTVIDGSLQWATTCASGACGSTRFSLLGTVVHEWGHAFGGLSDEYSDYTHRRGTVRDGINVAGTEDPKKVPFRSCPTAAYRVVESACAPEVYR